MSWLSDLGDAIGSGLGIGNVGSGIGDFITNDILGSTTTNAVSGATKDPKGSSFFNPGFLSAALQSATGLASGLYANKAQAEEARKAREYEMEKLKLQAQYGLLGGGGGGGSNRDAMMYKAYQDWIATRQNNRQQTGEAYDSLANVAMRALRR
jgi:F0F1-type ATP synthase membrane subunit c/vacuolar-type H+-ATPase subunit K